MLADMLRPPGQHRDHVLARYHAAIDADIHDVGVGVLGDDAAVGENVAAAVGAIPLRRREVVEIHIVALDDVLLDWSGLDDFRRDRAGENGAAEFDQLAWMGVGRQPEHHGDAAVARQRAGKDLLAAGVLAIVADLVEQQRRPVTGALGKARHWCRARYSNRPRRRSFATHRRHRAPAASCADRRRQRVCVLPSWFIPGPATLRRSSLPPLALSNPQGAPLATPSPRVRGGGGVEGASPLN